MPKRKTNNKKKRTRVSIALSPAEGPPVHDYQLKLKPRFAFRCTTATTTHMKVSCVLNMLSVAATTNTAYRLMKSFRIKSVEAWQPATVTSGVPVPYGLNLRWADGGASYASRPTVELDIPVGTVENAHVRLSPRSNTIQSAWFTDGASTDITLIDISAAPGCVLVIDLDAVMYTSTQDGVASANSVSGAGLLTVGQTYVMGPEGVVVSSSNWISLFGVQF